MYALPLTVRGGQCLSGNKAEAVKVLSALVCVKFEHAKVLCTYVLFY